MSKFLEAVEAEKYKNNILYGDWGIDDMDVECIKQYGGEGKGDSIWAVYRAVEDGVTRYYKAEGWYASYEGASFGHVYEVEPYQETVTKFREVN
jgi:hypothetical protein